MNNMSNLWVFGDSFAFQDQKDIDCRRVWPQQLATKLSGVMRRPFKMVNLSLLGSSQDYAWFKIREHLDQMQPHDYMVVLLTSANRVWFFEDMPHLSSSHVIDFDEVVGEERSRAAELYIKHMQRPVADFMAMDHRLAWLDLAIKQRGLRRPLLLKCFEASTLEPWPYDNLNLAKGTLFDVQNKEWADGPKTNNNWNGFDIRHMHLCLRNHDVLSDKMLQSLWRGLELDLTLGFHSNFMNFEDWENAQMLEEFNPRIIEQHKEFIAKPKDTTSWFNRKGIDKIFKTS